MTKTILIAIIFVLAVLLVHSYITVTELKTELDETKSWINDTEKRVGELKAISLETQNICAQYLQDQMLLMDYGNDQSKK